MPPFNVQARQLPHDRDAERLPIHTLIGTPEPCPRLMDGVTRPESLAMYAAGRPLEQAARDSYAVTYAEPENE